MKNDFDKVIKSILKEKDSQELNDYFDSAMEIYHKSYTTEVESALEKYISTEFDTDSKGLKGVGRMLTDIPRFAGYMMNEGLKETVVKFESDALLLAKMGFLAGILIRNNKTIPFIEANSNEIYEKFVPNIFITPQEVLSNPSFKNFLSFLTNDTLDKILETAKEAKKNINETTLIQIFAYYYIAGFALSSTLYNFDN